MNIKIEKASNGWLLIRSYVNTGRQDVYVFKDIYEMAEWITNRLSEMEREEK